MAGTESFPRQAVQNLAAEVSSLSALWAPKCVTTINDSHSLKVARIQGEFIWHAHPDTDELFYVVSGGPLRLELADAATNDETKGEIAAVELNVGDLFSVPRSRRHRPVAHKETGILIIEKVGTINTGDETGSEKAKTLTRHVDEGIQQ